MDYLSSHPWVVAGVVVAVGVGVWWWSTRREKFLIDRIRSLRRRKQVAISNPYNILGREEGSSRWQEVSDYGHWGRTLGVKPLLGDQRWGGHLLFG